MKQYLLTIITIFIMSSTSIAQESIINLIVPVSYFVNHVKQLNELQDNLLQYRKTSIVGISGMGKTQIARMHAYEHKYNYKMIWFIDCNLDTNEEFLKLAKAINTITKSKIILEDVSSVKQEIVNYLSSKDGWLLVLDNLKINENSKIKEFIDWEHNGHIIFSSQDSELLPNIVKMEAFRHQDAITLASNLVRINNIKLIEFLAKEFNGYPILIVQGAQLLNQIPGLSYEEYRKKIEQSTDKIRLNITLAIQELNPNTKNLLNKIALINNQSFSKDLLKIITNDQTTIDDDIYTLSKFAFIANIDASQDNPVFEMHDVIAQKIREINGKKVNTVCLEDIVTKLVNVVPKTVIKSHVFRVAKTIRENLEIIGKNTIQYNVNVYKSMELNVQLINQYVDSLDLYNVKNLVNWFNQNEQQGNFKLWLMNDKEKCVYADYLGLIGSYYRRLSNHHQAINYFIKAKEAFRDIKGYESFKYDIILCLGKSYLALGNLQKAEENIQIAEQMFNDGLVDKADITLLYFAKARLFFTKGQYFLSLEQINKSIEQIIESGIQHDDLYLTGQYLLKSEVLNYLGKYQEAYKQIKQLYNMYQASKKENHATFGEIFTQMSRTELGLGNAKEALEYAEKATTIFVKDLSRNNNDLTTSTDIYLAKALVAQGNALAALGQNNKSISSYTSAENLYWNNYQNNMSNVDEISRMYLDAAKSTCNLPEKVWYAKFHDEHITRFGSEHPRSIELLNMDTKCYH